MKETLKIKDLDQLKLLSDPLKLALLQFFAKSPGTAKDAAAALREPLTKLYRHVDALFEAGLLTVVRERQKRGTVERTFQAVARRFEADHSLFQGDDEGVQGSATIRNLLDAGVEEILAALQTAALQDKSKDPTKDQKIILTRLRLEGSSAQIDKWRGELAAWLDSVQLETEDEESGGEQAGALIAFYPVRRDAE